MARDSVVRITTAGSSRADDIARRQRRYVFSMGIRTVCFLSAVLVGPGWLRWVLVVGAVVLPYVAVVMANAVTSKDDEFALRGVTPDHAQLAEGSDDAAPRAGYDNI
jgi:hypothetical protein